MAGINRNPNKEAESSIGSYLSGIGSAITGFLTRAGEAEMASIPPIDLEANRQERAERDAKYAAAAAKMRETLANLDKPEASVQAAAPAPSSQVQQPAPVAAPTDTAAKPAPTMSPEIAKLFDPNTGALGGTTSFTSLKVGDVQGAGSPAKSEAKPTPPAADAKTAAPSGEVKPAAPAAEVKPAATDVAKTASKDEPAKAEAKVEEPAKKHYNVKSNGTQESATLQDAIKHYGARTGKTYDLGKYGVDKDGIDGVVGPKTRAAVAAISKDLGIAPPKAGEKFDLAGITKQIDNANKQAGKRTLDQKDHGKVELAGNTEPVGFDKSFSKLKIGEMPHIASAHVERPEAPAQTPRTETAEKRTR